MRKLIMPLLLFAHLTWGQTYISLQPAILSAHPSPVTLDPGIIILPASDGGTRLMWVPAKSAFRVGTVEDTQWNLPNIGLWSFATGYNTTANGITSTSTGFSTTASGDQSTSMGVHTIASGDISTSMGYYTTASGLFSSSMGYYTTASGGASTSMGYITTASGENSTSMGYRTTAQAQNSVAMGYHNIIAGTTYADAPTDPLLAIGNGSFTTANNALTLLKNANLGINVPSPKYPLVFKDVLGDKISLFYGNTSNTTNHYGFGVQPARLQMFTPTTADDIVFGIGRSVAFTENVRFKGNGDVGIGINPTQRLHVSGNILATGTITSISDIRFKKNFSIIENPLAKILTLRGLQYDWRVEEFKEQHFSKNRQIGFIAQEIEKTFPEMVLTDAQGYKSVDYARLTPVLVEAIKELVQKNEQLTKTIELLKNDKDKMESRLDKIEALIIK